jgi:hypothetical protein
MRTCALIILTLLGPNSRIYVKGHSRAAAQVRQHLGLFTCYQPAAIPEDSAAILNVDHLRTRSGNRKVVMVLTDTQGKLVWEGKTEEYPWPVPSPLDRLLKRLARSTCLAARVAERDSAVSPK